LAMYKTKFNNKLKTELGKISTEVNTGLSGVIKKVDRIEKQLTQLTMKFDFFKQTFERSNDLRHDFDTELMSLISNNFDLNASFLEDLWGSRNQPSSVKSVSTFKNQGTIIPEKILLRSSPQYIDKVTLYNTDQLFEKFLSADNKCLQRFEKYQIGLLPLLSRVHGFLKHLPQLVPNQSKSSSGPLKISQVTITPELVDIVFDHSKSDKCKLALVEPSKKESYDSGKNILYEKN